MKRKYIDRSNWKRIKASKSIVVDTFTEQFEGYASVLFIESVHDKLMCHLTKEPYCLTDDGYIWLQRLPVEKNWTVTTMFDEKNHIIQWYFDITKHNSIDENNQPFYDDLYLDVVVLPSGEIMLLDEDELENALVEKVITQEDFDLAYHEAHYIMNGIAKDIQALTNISYTDLDFFKSKAQLKN